MSELARALSAFAQTEPMSEYTRTTLAPHLPEPVAQLWEYGVGYLGDGFLRTVDPARIAAVVAQVADPIHVSHSFPILTTAFADIITCWHSRLYLINTRFGRYCGLGRTEQLPRVIAELLGPNRQFLTGATPWAAAARSLGVPEPYECFAYVPPLAAMPRSESDLTGLVRTGLVAHLRFLAEFTGRVHGRF